METRYRSSLDIATDQKGNLMEPSFQSHIWRFELEMNRWRVLFRAGERSMNEITSLSSRLEALAYAPEVKLGIGQIASWCRRMSRIWKDEVVVVRYLLKVWQSASWDEIAKTVAEIAVVLPNKSCKTVSLLQDLDTYLDDIYEDEEELKFRQSKGYSAAINLLEKTLEDWDVTGKYNLDCAADWIARNTKTNSTAHIIYLKIRALFMKIKESMETSGMDILPHIMKCNEIPESPENDKTAEAPEKDLEEEKVIVQEPLIQGPPTSANDNISEEGALKQNCLSEPESQSPPDKIKIEEAPDKQPADKAHIETYPEEPKTLSPTETELQSKELSMKVSPGACLLRDSLATVKIPKESQTHEPRIKVLNWCKLDSKTSDNLFPVRTKRESEEVLREMKIFKAQSPYEFLTIFEEFTPWKDRWKLLSTRLLIDWKVNVLLLPGISTCLDFTRHYDQIYLKSYLMTTVLLVLICSTAFLADSYLHGSSLPMARSVSRLSSLTQIDIMYFWTWKAKAANLHERPVINEHLRSHKNKF
ncbi:hypothetical protein SteCoe_39200 [Stentor coeruleus]|uniref:Uncharacterized protein n=1 Tax=Stentor coeruleus TaxID=5963 RepID=A0A1R2AKV2_9CILI|nr:hypothetical protein SteCoe_39200 [Stentor coeruleus]